MSIVNRVYLSILAALVLLLAVQTCRLQAAEKRETRERAGRQSAELALAGFEKGETDKHPEDATPGLAGPAQAAKEAGAKTVIAWRTRTEQVPFYVPTDCGTVPPAEPPGAGEGKPPAPPPPVMVSADLQAILAPNDLGELHLAAKIAATLTRGEWSQTEDLPIAQSDLRVHPDVEKAWAEFQSKPPRIVAGFRKPAYWRAGWFAGLGLASNFQGDVTAGVLVGYGVSF